MQHSNKQLEWQEFCRSMLSGAEPLFLRLGIVLDDEQPHLEGERYLMQALTTQSGRKLILIGTYSGKKAVIKVTNEKSGKEEIEHERLSRDVLSRIQFAYQVFHTPQELLFIQEMGYTIYVQEFIEQEKAFLARPTPEQFDFALCAFKAQESAHATTYEHEKLITRTFGCRDAKGYQENFASFLITLTNISCYQKLLEVQRELYGSTESIDRYGKFLTHTDFVPHNFRIENRTMYLLDHSSLRFGNKYEGWARFINFMTLYNPDLEEALLFYVGKNRTHEEYELLRLMRLYRLGEIIHYYQQTLDKSFGNLLTLNKARIEWWCTVLEAVYNRKDVPDKVRDVYIKTRDNLRDEEEKKRQKNLH